MIGRLISKGIRLGMKYAPKIGKAFGQVAEGSRKFGQLVEGGRKFGQVVDAVSGGKLGQTKFYKDADALADKAQQISGQIAGNSDKAGASIQRIGKAFMPRQNPATEGYV